MDVKISNLVEAPGCYCKKCGLLLPLDYKRVGCGNFLCVNYFSNGNKKLTEDDAVLILPKFRRNGNRPG